MLVLLAVVLGAASPAHGATDARQRRREVQRRRAQAVTRVDVLRASDRQLAAALDALEARRRAQTAAVGAARQRALVAEAAAAEARAAEERTRRRLIELRQELRSAAVDAYLGGRRPQEVLVGVGNPMDRVRRRVLLDVAATSVDDTADALNAAEEDLRIDREAKEASAALARSRRAAAEDALHRLAEDEDAQRAVAASVEARLEAALAEAGALASLDRRLASEVARQQRGLARRVRAVPRRGPAAIIRPIRGTALANVRGIVVASSVARQLERLLDAAAADGIRLSGGGYRDPSQQAALRRRNCGGDVYRRPASSCSPPTARPGASMHERGTAIDFTANGRLITSRSNRAFQWLRANASRFGLRNLPSEPWHWSTNGR